MKKRVLIATDTFLPKLDGVSIFLSEVVPELSKYYNITILCPGFPGKIKNFSNVKIIKTKKSNNLVLTLTIY